uniref:Uncharacterized protein n=1 Tax=Mycena chlorophos TaxID=658473 RepID=A0ABQ0LCS4_MYCCL|nr:predicted protein [Mycena chlorophos]
MDALLDFVTVPAIAVCVIRSLLKLGTLEDAHQTLIESHEYGTVFGAILAQVSPRPDLSKPAVDYSELGWTLARSTNRNSSSADLQDYRKFHGAGPKDYHLRRFSYGCG